jgi:DNA-directed RNA polymerase specialized sigma24 family protein
MKKLTVDWWIRDRHAPQVRKALCWGFADHCYDVVEAGLESNKARNLWPNSWTSYTNAIALASDANVTRKRRGENPTAVHECIGIATLIDTAPPQLTPPQCGSWLLAAVLYLCDGLPLKSAEIFVAYSLQQLARHRKRQAGLRSKERPAFVELVLNDTDIRELAEELRVDFQHAQRAISDAQRQCQEALNA